MKRSILFIWFVGVVCHLYAQLISFESGVPDNITVVGGKGIAVTADYYKDGKNSLQWNFTACSQLDIRLEEPLTVDRNVMRNYGIYLWIYNEKAQTDSLRFEFYDEKGIATHTFSFRLFSKGWRACWIGFAHMRELNHAKKICGVRLLAPGRSGTVYLDRITLPVRKVNLRTTPDYQMPDNNSLGNRDLWHWCLVWYWEQLAYDIPLPNELTGEQTTQLRLLEQRMDETFHIRKYPDSCIDQAYALFAKAGIARSRAGFVGIPLVAPDEKNEKEGELSWAELQTMLVGFAVDVLRNRSEDALAKYTLTWAYAIDQGFAWGSGMGTNHHYGYQVGEIFATSWLMRRYIYDMKNSDDILAALRFWSALQETRQPCASFRDELLDSWHTLTAPKCIAAMLYPDDRWKYRAMLGLSRWVSTSLRYTPGTIGGIKPDGTTFHHGMFYPAYTTGVLAHLGNFVRLTDETDFEPTVAAKQVLKKAFITMRNCSNRLEWGMGLSGRHPFGGRLSQSDVNAFGYLALAGDLSDMGDDIDRELASDYLRLNTKNTPEARLLSNRGVQPATAPQGFFVYNYGAAGIHRRKDWMVTLKGYNSNVCTSEIYAKDNRYGRYQGYGSVQIFGQTSRKASGYEENGWDWNRLPGSTTIHLPFHLLESPTPGAMIRSREEFAGSSALDGKNGIFGIKLAEADRKNHTPDFVARKSVFCFDNRLVCLGSGISNSNDAWPTETTLFQSRFAPQHELLVNGSIVDTLGYTAGYVATKHQPVLLRDGYSNYYRIEEGNVKVQIAEQQSRHERSRKPTHGKFSSAWLDHGYSPKNAAYEYMILIQPSPDELAEWGNKQWYHVIRRDDKAHIVRDGATGITGYVVFDALDMHGDEYLQHVDAETLVMLRHYGQGLHLSVCDPNLNIQEKTYTTPEASKPLHKHVILHGEWRLDMQNEKVSVQYRNGDTVLTILCQHGIPVEFTLLNVEL